MGISALNGSMQQFYSDLLLQIIDEEKEEVGGVLLLTSLRSNLLKCRTWFDLQLNHFAAIEDRNHSIPKAAVVLQLIIKLLAVQEKLIIAQNLEYGSI